MEAAPEVEAVDVSASTVDDSPKRGRGRPKGSTTRKSDTSGSANRGAPTAAEWSPKARRILGYAAAGFLWIAFLRVEMDTDDETAVQMLATRWCNEVAEPLADIFAKSRLNKKYGRKLISNEGLLRIIVASVFFLRDTMRLRKAIVQKHQFDRVTPISGSPTPSSAPPAPGPQPPARPTGGDAVEEGGDVRQLPQIMPQIVGSQYQPA